MPTDQEPTTPPSRRALIPWRRVVAGDVEVISELIAGVPAGDRAREAAVQILTGWDEGALLAPFGYLHPFIADAVDRDGNPRLTVRYRELYLDAAGADSAVPEQARHAVMLACALVTCQTLPAVGFTASTWSRDNAAVILGAWATLLGFTGASPDAVIPHLMETVAAHEETLRRLRALCRTDGPAPGATLMREVDEPTGAAGRPVLPGVLAVLVEDVLAIVDGRACAADSAPGVCPSTAVLDLHPTAGAVTVSRPRNPG
jgi:hypothetical protein